MMCTSHAVIVIKMCSKSVSLHSRTHWAVSLTLSATDSIVHDGQGQGQGPANVWLKNKLQALRKASVVGNSDQLYDRVGLIKEISNAVTGAGFGHIIHLTIRI